MLLYIHRPLSLLKRTLPLSLPLKSRTMSSTTEASAALNKNWAGKDGHYRRQVSSFRDVISKAPGSKFPPEKNRYHLYVSLACPWAHRVLIVRELKGLQDILPVSVVDWHMGANGWNFTTPDKVPGSTEDKLFGSKLIKEVYYRANPDYSARFTVPVIYDTKNDTIVNNESSEIIRFLNTEFDDLVDEKYRGLDFYPPDLRTEIDGLNEWIYDNINNGVYKAGFASTQEAYELNVKKVFESLARVEDVLGKSSGPYLIGDRFTEADIRLYTTIIRFDVVYVQHFKCNIGMIRYDFPNIHKWVRNLYWNVPGFKETTDFDHIKGHYTKSHVQINPFGITPLGPIPNVVPL